MGDSGRKVGNLMVVYRLMHYHECTESTCGDACLLGYFKDLVTIYEVEKQYRKLPGFSQYPNGFCIFEVVISGEEEIENDIVYEVGIEIRDEEYDLDWVSFPGVFSRKIYAEEELKKFQFQNREFIENKGLIIECTVSAYKLDKMEWREGFDYD